MRVALVKRLMMSGPLTSKALGHPPRPMLRFWGWMACLLVATLIGLTICGAMRPAPHTIATHTLPAMLESGLRGLPIWYHLWVAGTVALIAHLHVKALWKRLVTTFMGIAVLYALIGLAVLVGLIVDIVQRCDDGLAGTCGAVSGVLMDLVGKLAVAWTLEVILPLALFTTSVYVWLGLGLRLAERLKAWLDRKGPA